MKRLNTYAKVFTEGDDHRIDLETRKVADFGKLFFNKADKNGLERTAAEYIDENLAKAAGGNLPFTVWSNLTSLPKYISGRSRAFSLSFSSLAIPKGEGRRRKNCFCSYVGLSQ